MWGKNMRIKYNMQIDEGKLNHPTTKSNRKSTNKNGPSH